ncbi:tetratricopeptide (TPR) repeat protein [Azospirillum sp. OGB3]|uniref:tetratricopeptide repeat protein n=1 Tax=Azospirillum sp. OGB3 TaxID=2587012 RepID=UPI001605D5CE|nr:tetratricopeptide repeat protein [Azospirillum sp. OGB3]MBB3265700.1 tetratricopeptide (TPR) repeat protein [Azospirillum sp. OGB3]
MVTLRDALAAAVGHHQAGRLDAARPLYHSILRSQPGHPDALHLLGVLESQSGHPGAALPLLRRAVALLPGDADFLGNLARSLRAAGQPEAAECAFARTAALDPEDVQIAFALGSLRLERGDAAGAATAFAQTLAQRPDFAEARINRANALAALGRAEDAARLRRQAVALAPALPDALHNAAVSALADAGLDRPLSHARRLDPELVERAGRALTRAHAVDPGHGAAADALLGTALSLVQAGQAPEWLLDRAARTALTVLRRNPRDTRAAAVVAYRFYRRGRTDLAARFMGRVSRRFTPSEVEADFELRLWSMVRAGRRGLDGLPDADTLLDSFPSLELLAEPPAGSGPLLAVSCDDGYYRRFATGLLDSVAAAGGGVAVHVHVVNPSPETLADLARRRERLPLGISREGIDFAGWDEHRRTTYYACIRFLRWHQLMARWGRPLLHLDADCTLTGGLDALAALLDGADVGLLRDARWRGPTREITVCFAAFQPTPRGRAFLALTAAYIGAFLREGRGFWMLDQAAPFAVFDALQRRGEGLSVRWFDVLDFPWVRFIGEK